MKYNTPNKGLSLLLFLSLSTSAVTPMNAYATSEDGATYMSQAPTEEAGGGEAGGGEAGATYGGEAGGGEAGATYGGEAGGGEAGATYGGEAGGGEAGGGGIE